MIEEEIKKMKESIEKMRKELEKTETDFKVLLETHFYTSLWKSMKKDEIISFVKKPYVIVPYKEGEWRLFVPKFIPLEIGWLEYQTESYNVFRVNKYIDWLTPIPDILKEELGIEKPEFELSFDWEKSILNVEKGDLEKVKKKYGKFIYRQLNHSTFQIKSPQKFSFVIQLLKDGILPFRPKPANPDDFYLNERAKFQLRDYQKQAWDYFLKYSHIGVFYPYGAGKSMLGLYALSKIKGLKLIVVPSLTLKEQWERRIESMTSVSKDEYIVTTYQSAIKENIRRKKYSLVIYDECHHLPANVFSLFAFIDRRYTIGLSGCIAKNTQVLVKNSWKPIETILPNEKIISIKNEQIETEVENIWESDWFDKKPYLIETLSGRKIKLTNDHPILTLNGWKKAEEIKEGELVVCYNEIPIEEKFLELSIENSIKHPKKMRIKIDINKIKSNGRLLAKILGFAIGDANLDKNYRLTFTVSSNEIESIKKALDKLGLDDYVYKKKGRDSYSIRVRSYNFGRILNFLGMPIGNKRNIELKIPEWIYEYNLEREFLSGLWGSEGTPSRLRLKKNKYKSSIFFEGAKLALNTKNEELLKNFFEEIVKLHRKLGIKVKYRIVTTKEGSKKYELRVLSSLKNIIRFSHIIEFSFSPNKQRKNDDVLNFSLIKEKFLNEKMEKIKNNDKSIPYATRRDWIKGKRNFVELRNFEIKLPILPKNFRLEKVVKSTYLKDKFPIFDLRVPETENFVANGFVTHNSPYREDGRTELIFALTGYPVGADWSYFFKKGIVEKPKVKVIIVKSFDEKVFELERLMEEKAITIIYCDSIEKGKMLSNKLNCEFLFGETKKRLKIIEKELDEKGSIILSRIGDEGISLPEIQRIIEFDFLYGSRRQESQRVGRLFHSLEKGEHYILMTLEEFTKYKKRLYSLIEKGIELEIEQKI
jgi:intein/homing endonuclease